jgi:hypothetical protein
MSSLIIRWILIGIICILIYICWRSYDYFIDIPSDASSGSSSKQSPVVSEFNNWNSKFCTIWLQVIDQAKQQQSREEYLSDLSGDIFTGCLLSNPPVISSEKDIITYASQYQYTMSFMKSEMNTILKNTENALKGVPPTKAETFADVGSYTCTPASGSSSGSSSGPSSGMTLTCSPSALSPSSGSPSGSSPSKIDILKYTGIFNKTYLSNFEEQLIEINDLMKQLQDYQDKAQSGELVNQIKLPSS